jgi:hypothetical protein
LLWAAVGGDPQFLDANLQTIMPPSIYAGKVLRGTVILVGADSIL